MARARRWGLFAHALFGQDPFSDALFSYGLIFQAHQVKLCCAVRALNDSEQHCFACASMKPNITTWVQLIAEILPSKGTYGVHANIRPALSPHSAHTPTFISSTHRPTRSALHTMLASCLGRAPATCAHQAEVTLQAAHRAGEEV